MIRRLQLGHSLLAATLEDLKLEKSGHLIDVAECDVRVGVEAYESNERQREDGKTGVWWRWKVEGKGEQPGGEGGTADVPCSGIGRVAGVAVS